MSFNGSKQGAVFNAGNFLANGDEDIRRETRTASASSALVVTGADGSKHIPAGTAYPTNNGSAVGILYEDVDVSTGDMPCSVITDNAIIYKDRLCVTGADYNSVTLKDLVSPKAQGWQERSGEVGHYTYADSTDTTVNTSKTYYLDDDDHTEVSDYAAVLNPVAEGWYESDGAGGYELSDDTAGDKTKTYYTKSPVTITVSAQSALEAKGFKFIASAPAVTRPY